MARSAELPKQLWPRSAASGRRRQPLAASRPSCCENTAPDSARDMAPVSDLADAGVARTLDADIEGRRLSPLGRQGNSDVVGRGGEGPREYRLPSPSASRSE